MKTKLEITATIENGQILENQPTKKMTLRVELLEENCLRNSQINDCLVRYLMDYTGYQHDGLIWHFTAPYKRLHDNLLMFTHYINNFVDYRLLSDTVVEVNCIGMHMHAGDQRDINENEVYRYDYGFELVSYETYSNEQKINDIEKEEFAEKLSAMCGGEKIEVTKIDKLPEGASFVTYQFAGNRQCVAVVHMDGTIITPDDWQAPDVQHATAKDISQIDWPAGVVVINGLPRIFTM